MALCLTENQVVLAVANGADLSEADLRGANLSEANLSEADLSEADLRGANLRGANLSEANLREANLREAYLSEAYLSEANLCEANLCGADLSEANLRNANLSETNLSGANLSGANLSRAMLPSPTMVLLANWRFVSASTTRELMRFDASSHPNGTSAFNLWANGGACPYVNCHVNRAANFTEMRKLWSPGRPLGIYKLMAMVLDEKCPGWDKEE